MPLPDLDTLSVSELEDLVRYHNRRYWDLDSPEINDYEYDRLVGRLREVAPGSAVLQSMGPAVAREPGSEVRHRVPMLSLDKCYSDEDLDRWAATLEGDLVVMPKFDGIACSLRYDAQGDLVQAATRGDGVVGDDITLNVREIKDVPRHLATDRALEVRGEVYLKLSVFARFKAEGMANPRNLAAGAIKQKDPKKSAAYALSFAGYDLLGSDLATHGAMMERLVAAGFAPVEHRVLPRAQAREGYAWCAALRPTLDYEIDGVVFRADRCAEQQRLGVTGHHPRYALAYKFQGESGTSVLREVEWSVARTGAITPVAVVDPVPLSGVTVTRASLHHAGFIKKLGLTRGAEVVMMRRGGVIPNVEAVSRPGTEPIAIPVQCPACGAPVRWEKDFVLCSQPATCRSAMVGQLAHYAATVDLLGFGDVILEQAYDAGVLRTPADFYTATWAQLAALEKCSEKVARKLVAEVDRKRTLDLATFLRALGIAELGKHVSGILAQRYGTLDAVRQVTAADLAQIHSIGDTIAASVVQGLRAAAPLIEALRLQVTILAPEAAGTPARAAGPFAGRSFVFTGKLATLERKAAEEMVRQLGGTALDAVNKTLSFLVVGDQKTPAKSSKEKAADKLVAAGATLRIITESDFLAMVAAGRLVPVTAEASPPAAPPPPAEVVTPAATVPVAAAPETVVVAATAPSRRAREIRLEGKTFAFAGTLAVLPAGEAARRIEAAGGRVASAVDAAVTHLVLGAKGRSGEQLGEARRLQRAGHAIEILDEQAFASLLGVGQLGLFS